MLKRRIIPIELLDGDRLVKTIEFSSPRDVGDPRKSSQVYSSQDADELILLNIDRNNRNVIALTKMVEKIAQECFVPLTVGGGISTLNDATNLFTAGADKVLINTATYTNLDLITEISSRYGRQAVVVGIDVRNMAGKYELFSHCGLCHENTSLAVHANAVVGAGVGEILIQSIDRDGTMGGYDLNLLEKMVEMVNVPIIIAGGAGNFMDLKVALEAGASAVACGSLFNFGDNNPIRAKAFLKNYNIPLKRT